MGQELRPDSPLFADAAAHPVGEPVEPAPAGTDGAVADDFAGDDAVGVDVDAEPVVGFDEPDLMDQSLDPAFAFDVDDLEATGDFSTAFDEVERQADDGTIEFDVGGGDVAAAADAGPAVATGADVDVDVDDGVSMTGIDAPELDLSTPLDLSDEDQLSESLGDDLTLDLDQLSEELTLDGTEMLEMPDLTADNDLMVDEAMLSGGADEVDTMMDLAKAYIDMGDRDSASSTLDEIVKSGTPDQVTEAESLRRKIS